MADNVNIYVIRNIFNVFPLSAVTLAAPIPAHTSMTKSGLKSGFRASGA